MKNKKSISLTIAMMLLLMSMGCDNNKQSTPSTSATAKTEGTTVKTEITTEAVVSNQIDLSQKLTISWMGFANNPTAQEGTYPEKLLEEKFNVDIKPMFLDNEGYKTKRPVLIASGDIPDLLYLNDPVDVQQTALQGAILELPYQKIQSVAPNYYKRLTEDTPLSWMNAYHDGKNWGIPNGNPEGNNAKAFGWRMDWLKNVGINKVPETLEEMEIAFDKFVNADPDKNGKKDTYALSGDIKSWHMCFTEIFGAYGVIPFNWMEKDGEVIYGASLPETKIVLEKLADWYKKGYIHPDFITDTFSKTIPEKFNNGKIGYIGNFQMNSLNTASPTTTISIMKELFPDVELAPAHVISGPDGKSGMFAWGTGGHIITLGQQLKNQPEKVDRILYMIEEINNDDDLMVKLHIGEEGVHWEYNNAMTEFSSVRYIGKEPYNDTKQLLAEGFRAFLLGPSYFSLIPASNELNAKFETESSLAFKEKYNNPKYSMNDLFLKPDSLPSAGQYYNDLKDKQLLAFAQIILGEKPVSYLDEFLIEWSKNGGDILLKEAKERGAIQDNVINEIKTLLK